jgi:peptide/nickel transport system permease protein
MHPGPFVADRGQPDSSGQRRWRTPWRDGLARFRRNPSGMLGLLFLTIMIVAHLGAPLFTPHDPGDMSVQDILQSPSRAHPLGTDRFGRDVLSRLLYGGRTSLLVACVVTLITSFTGLLFGTLAGFFRRLDGPIMRMMDLVMGIPVLMLAIACVAILGPQLLNVVIALVIPITPRTARVVRSVILSLKGEEFVTAARSIGAGDGRIIIRHLLPGVLPSLLVRQTYVFGVSILTEGALNFLGIGVQPEVPTLGTAVADGYPFLRQMPWLSFSAGIAIALLVLGVNLLGDGLRDVLDPKMKE